MSRFPPNFSAKGLPIKVLLAVMTGENYLSLPQIVALVGERIPSEAALRYVMFNQLIHSGKSLEEFRPKSDMEGMIAKGRRGIVREVMWFLMNRGDVITKDPHDGSKRYKIDHRAVKLRKKTARERMLRRKEIGPPKKVRKYCDELADETHPKKRIYTLECGHDVIRRGWGRRVQGWKRCPTCKAAKSDGELEC